MCVCAVANNPILPTEPGVCCRLCGKHDKPDYTADTYINKPTYEYLYNIKYIILHNCKFIRTQYFCNGNFYEHQILYLCRYISYIYTLSYTEAPTYQVVICSASCTVVTNCQAFYFCKTIKQQEFIWAGHTHKTGCTWSALRTHKRMHIYNYTEALTHYFLEVLSVCWDECRLRISFKR